MDVTNNNGMGNRNFFQPVLQLVAGLLLVSLVLTLPALAFRHHGPKDPEEMLANLKMRLRLSEDQVRQVRPILEEQMQKQKEFFESFRSDGSKDRSAMRSQMQAIREDTEKRLAQVLTPGQMEEYRKLREERRQHMRSRMGKGSRSMNN